MREQSGFALIQLVIASIVATVIAIWGAQAFVNQLNDSKAQSAAQWMLNIQDGVSEYIYTYSQDMKKASNKFALQDNGFIDWSKPTLNELKQAGFLSNSIKSENIYLGGIKIFITKQGDCDVAVCNLDALITSEEAALNNNKIDLPFITQWLLSTKGKGAVVYPESSHKIRGKLFEYDNPIDGETLLQVGTLVLGMSKNSASSDRFLTIKDERDPYFQGDLSAEGDLNIGNNVYIDGNLRFNSASQWLSQCSSPNSITRDNYYGLLVCLGGAWHTVGRSPGAFSINTKYGCRNNTGVSTHNPVTGSCSCPMGYISVQVSEGSTGVAGDGITYGYVCVL